MSIKEYSDDKDKLSTYVPYICLIDKGVVLNKNGTLQKTLKYRGYDLDSCTTFELKNINARLNNVLKRLGEGWSFNIEARRKKCTEYLGKNTDILAVNIIEEERKKNFFESEHFESEYYLTLVYLVENDATKKVGEIFLEYSEEKKKLDQTLEKFLKEFTQIKNLFSEIFLEVKELNDEETYTYLHSCVSTKDNVIKVPEVPYAISNYICDTDLIGGLEPKLGNKELRVISLQGFPNYTVPGFFDELNRLNIEYRWITRFLCLSKLEALSKLDKHYKTVFSGKFTLAQRVMAELTGDAPDERKANEDAVEKSDSIKEQKTLTEGDIVSQGFYTCSIILTGDTEAEVDEKVELIVKKIDSMGFTTIVESINSVQAFLGSIPGNITNNIRRPILNSITLSHLLPTSSVWSGERMNNHLQEPSLIYTKTKGSTPFRFNLHIKDIGHTSIIGPTGSGKSVLLGLIAASFLKYDKAKVFFFDKDASSRILTYSVGGKFNDLGNDNSLSFQPLKRIGTLQENLDEIENKLRKKEEKIKKVDINSEEISKELLKYKNELLEQEMLRANQEKEWALGWLLEILEQENVKVSPTQKKKLWEALENISATEEKLRTMSNLVTTLNEKEMGEALEQYTVKGALGKYFDSDYDNLDFVKWQVFEMNEIINNKQAITPMLSYIFRRIEASLDGSPVILILDECWMFFDNEKFASKIRDWLKTLRKKNASVIFATQELGDIMNSKLFTTILDACKTKVFLPNPNAQMDSYLEIYKKFGLNDTEIELIAEGTPKKEYYYKSELGSRKFELDLKEKTLRLIASSDKDSQAAAKELIKIISSPEEFTREWLNLKKAM